MEPQVAVSGSADVRQEVAAGENCVLDLSASSVDSESFSDCSVESESKDPILQNHNILIVQQNNPIAAFHSSQATIGEVATSGSCSKQISTRPVLKSPAELPKSAVLNPASITKRYQPILPAKVPKNPPVQLQQPQAFLKLSAIDQSNVCRPFQNVTTKHRKPVTKIAPAPVKPQSVSSCSFQQNQPQLPATIVLCPVNQTGSNATGVNLKLTPYKPILPAPAKPQPIQQPTFLSLSTNTNQRFVQIENPNLIINQNNSGKVNIVEKVPPRQSNLMESESKPINPRPTSIVHPFNTTKKPAPIKVKPVKMADGQKSPISTTTVLSGVVTPSKAPPILLNPVSIQSGEANRLQGSDTANHPPPSREPAFFKEIRESESEQTKIKQEATSPIVTSNLNVDTKSRSTSVESIRSDDVKLTIDESDSFVLMPNVPLKTEEPSTELSSAKVEIEETLISDGPRKMAVIEPTILKHFINGIWIDELIPEKKTEEKCCDKSVSKDKEGKSNVTRKRPNLTTGDQISISSSSESKKKKPRKSGDYALEINDPLSKAKSPIKKQVAEKSPVAVKSNPINQSLSLEIPGSPGLLSDPAAKSTGNKSALLLTSSSTSSSGVFSASDSSNVSQNLSNDLTETAGVILSPLEITDAGTSASDAVIPNYPPPPMSPIRPPCQKPIMQWSTSDVYKFIKSIPAGSEHADQFKNQDIDGQALSMLKECHLMSAMKMKLGPALKICSSIRKLKEQGF
ncbi:uncharacterized protein LOC142336486 [Convolutriloba macropyga]|uniref:uncharacterized protein LOC142336486 n=1 Tax=Convolutriloba macropyga TaxID=536237 RepID=UPI003F51FC49